MIVCHCEGVSDRAIRKAIREGASTRTAVARHCSAGRCCGGCAPVIDEILDSELAAEAAPGLAPFAELIPVV